MPHLFSSHFGTYEVERTDGGVRLTPFRHDRAPSAVGLGFLELAHHPDRVRCPMVRRGWLRAKDEGDGTYAASDRGRDDFVTVSWEKAVALVADEIDRVRTDYGNRSIFGGSYGWASAGRFHHAQSQIKRLLNLSGGCTSSVNSYSYGTANVMIPHIIGAEWRESGVAAPSWDLIARHTRHFIAFGGIRLSNAEVEAGGTGEHDVPAWLDRAFQRGMRMTVLSPVRLDVPAGRDIRYISVRPNTDTAVLIGMCFTLVQSGKADRAFIDRCTTGFDDFERYLLGHVDGEAKSAAWASGISGVPESVIEELAFTTLETGTLINLAWSLQRARFGEQPYWAAIALSAIAGQVGKPGSGFAFGLAAVNSTGQPIRRIKGPSFTQGPNPVPDFIPVAAITELLTRPGETLDYDGQRLVLPDIRLVYWAGGNPFHHHQDLNALATAFRRPDTIVVHESMWTATAKHADIVLPAALPFERNDVSASSRDNWIIASRKVLPAPEGVRTDHEILCAIADRLGFRQAFDLGMDEAAWLKKLYEGYRANQPELPPFEEFWQRGYAELDRGVDAPRPVSPLSAFIFDPVGQPLSTPSGRIELTSEVVRSFDYPDCPAHPTWLEPEEWLGSPEAERYPFHLLSPQPALRLHSQLEKARLSQAAKVGGYEIMRMNRQDAVALGIADGDLVDVFNARGTCRLAASLTDDVGPKIVVVETGAWFDPISISGDVVDLGGNPNTLTSDRRSSRLSQGCAANSALVDVRPVRIASH